jgi:hypothetical protein
MLSRFDQMKALLDNTKYFKLVCGAGNEDAEEVKRLTVLYTLAGAKGMDVSANVDVVKAGAEQIELHAAVAEDESIMKEWQMISEVNPDNHISMCLDRLHLSNFAFEKRVEKAKEIAGDRLIIQSDGYPMSGGEDDYNTTLQAIATADVLNKRFNMKLRKKTNTLIYKKKIEVNQLLSGGTNSLTAVLAKQTGVKFQGASLGTFARQIVKEVVDSDDFYNNQELINKGFSIAKQLVEANIGELNEQSLC